jgi:cobalamin biosynthesis Mg chelatase CobN
MAAMKRWLVLLLALSALAALGPARAEAKTPCRDKIFNEWYHDGKVASTYPISCYRDALKHIPPQVTVYTSLTDDIRLALQAAIDRSHGQHVPNEVGETRQTSSSAVVPASATSTTKSNSMDTAPTAADTRNDTSTTTDPKSTQPQTPVASATPASTSSSGVPLPVLVLGGIALVLVASGGIGLGVRRFRRGAH